MSKKIVFGLAIAVIVIAIQFVPIDRSNPPVQGRMEAPAAVTKVLRQSCFDCHSNETKWPWYSYVAPVSWVMAHHVGEGRGELNFSTWNELTNNERSELTREIWKKTSNGKMPLRSYLILHQDAKLSEDGLETLRDWSESSQKNDVQE
jgi:hypothetical protein